MNVGNLSENYAFGKIGSLGEGLGYLIGPGFQIAAVVVVFYFLIAAFQYITSGGDKTAIASARARITHSIIGISLLILMFLVLQFIPKFFGIDILLIK